MIRTLAPLLLILAAPASAQEAPLPDSIGFDLLIAGTEQMSWTLGADGRGEALLRGEPGAAGVRTDRRIPLVAPSGGYDWAVRQIAPYRALAVAAPGCAITGDGVMAFRLTWREGGATHVASFSDNCGGVPTDFLATMRPSGERLEGWERPAPPPDPSSTTP